MNNEPTVPVHDVPHDEDPLDPMPVSRVETPLPPADGAAVVSRQLRPPGGPRSVEGVALQARQTLWVPHSHVNRGLRARGTRSEFFHHL